MSIRDDLHTIRHSLQSPHYEAGPALDRLSLALSEGLEARAKLLELELNALRASEAPLERCKACGKIWSHDCQTCNAVVEILSPAEQEARCWKTIEAWCNVERDARSIDLGPAFDRSGWGATLLARAGQSPHGTFYGATRLDALAQAAQWCESELNDPQGMTIRKDET